MVRFSTNAAPRARSYVASRRRSFARGTALRSGCWERSVVTAVVPPPQQPQQQREQETAGEELLIGSAWQLRVAAAWTRLVRVQRVAMSRQKQNFNLFASIPHQYLHVCLHRRASVFITFSVASIADLGGLLCFMWCQCRCGSGGSDGVYAPVRPPILGAAYCLGVRLLRLMEVLVPLLQWPTLPRL